MIKKIGFFVVMAAIIAASGGCQKENLNVRQLTDEAQPQFVVNDPMFKGLNEIAFSVEDNRLVFENEEEFQKGIDFLANLGDENFSAFEEVIGFDSYRKIYENDSVLSELFPDELYQVLLNPEKEIAVGNYLFREEPESEQTLAFEFDVENCSLKSSSFSPTYTFSWNDDAFAIIKGEEDLELKSISSDYCTGNIRGNVDFLFKSSN